MYQKNKAEPALVDAGVALNLSDFTRERQERDDEDHWE